MKRILLIAVLIGFLILFDSAYACIRMPTATFAEECSINYYGTPSIDSNFENKTMIIERLQQYKDFTYSCGRISLTDDNIEVISDFLVNGYSVIKQTPEKYQEFLENASKVNNDLTKCDYYSAVAHRDGWTGYVFNTESEKTVACTIAPRALCGGGPVNVIWNDLKSLSAPINPPITSLNYLWLIIIIVAIILIGVFKSKKK